MHDRSTVEVIFFQAIEAPSEAERTAVLDQACLDDGSLRRRVEVLRSAHLQMGKFLEHSLIESGSIAEFLVERVTASLATLGPSTEPDSLGCVRGRIEAALATRHLERIPRPSAEVLQMTHRTARGRITYSQDEVAFVVDGH